MKDFIRRPSTVYFLFYFSLLNLLMWEISLGVILMWFGGVLGMAFEWVDRFFYVYFTRPHEQLSIQVKSLVTQKRIWEAVLLIDHRKDEQKQITVRSLLFLLVWILASVFLITSSGSMFASGMVMGIGLSALVGMLKDLNNLGELKGRLFWQVKKDFSDMETKVVVVGFGVFFVILTLLFLL